MKRSMVGISHAPSRCQGVTAWTDLQTTRGLCRQTFMRWAEDFPENIYGPMVKDVLTLIASAKHGLLENEILDLVCLLGSRAFPRPSSCAATTDLISEPSTRPCMSSDTRTTLDACLLCLCRAGSARGPSDVRGRGRVAPAGSAAATALRAAHRPARTLPPQLPPPARPQSPVPGDAPDPEHPALTMMTMATMATMATVVVVGIATRQSMSVSFLPET